MAEKISGSSGNTPIQQIKKLAKDSIPDKTGNRRDASSISSDTVEISKEAKDIEKTVANLKAELKKISDVRAEKVETAQKRIQSGFYDTKEVIKETAEILLNDKIFKGFA